MFFPLCMDAKGLADVFYALICNNSPDITIKCVFSFRQLRASADQRVHYAVVPHHVRHLPAGAHRAEDLGLGFLRGVGGFVSRRPRHLGETGRVSS